tara:strand:- start:12949 stop:13890 length:942 start_codon:yes stop_codon:yes gene_type:complete
MGKRLAIAFAFLIAIFAVGAAIYTLLFSASEAPTGNVVADIPDASTNLVRASDARSSTESVIVGAIEGKLERKTLEGTWQVVLVGDSVSKDDALRTIGEGSSAVLEIGLDGTQIELAGECTVPTLTTELSTVQIVDGRVAARVTSSGESTVRVEAQGSDAVAETSDGDFSVLSTGGGKVAVASRRGSVAVSAAGKTVAVDAGEQTFIVDKGPPSPPTTLSPSLLLKVGKTARQLRVRETLVRGTTTPGAIVSVGGVRVQADAKGEFETMVALREGHNRFRVVVEDALGRTRGEDLPSVHVDSKAPKTQTGIEW